MQQRVGTDAVRPAAGYPRRMRRHASVATAVACLVLASASAASASRGPAVVHDTRIARIFVLGDTIVYQRRTPSGRDARPAWRRAIAGRVRAVRGLPAGAEPGAIGRDRAGRVVLTAFVSRYDGDVLAGAEWWLYDVAADRARPLGVSAPTGCTVAMAAIWRRRLAYATRCEAQPLQSDVLLRDGARTELVARLGAPPLQLALHGDTLAAIEDMGDGDSAVWRLVVGGRVCPALIAGSYLPEEWLHRGLWLDGQTLIWWTTAWAFELSGGPAGAQLHGCAPPGPTGFVRAAPPPPYRPGGVAIDEAWLYTADAHQLRRTRHAPLETAPPRNDDFRQPIVLHGNAPTSGWHAVGNATRQRHDPTSDAVWFTYRPTETHAIRIFVDGIEARVLAFRGTHLGALERVRTRRRPGGGVAMNARAGRTYRIAISTVSFQRYMPYRLRIRSR
jgi:hypothetical protein